jgi:hypothetical protein
MPTLNWIGKEAVVNHHLQVPFHLLKDVPELACGDPGSGNLIVQGDNLVALKALLPYYAGQVKCIYIDPFLLLPVCCWREVISIRCQANWVQSAGRHSLDRERTGLRAEPSTLEHANPRRVKT